MWVKEGLGAKSDGEMDEQSGLRAMGKSRFNEITRKIRNGMGRLH